MKLNRVKGFLDKYQTLGNSLQLFGRNLLLAKEDNYTNIEESDTADSDKVKDFMYDWNLIKDVKPNIVDNYNIKYIHYKGLIHFYVESKKLFKLENFEEAIRVFVNIINSLPTYMNAYFSLWKLLKHKNEYKTLLNFSYFMVKNAHDNEVTYEDWLNSYILYTKALFLNKRIDDAIELLRSLLDIFANIPIEEIKYLSEIYKSNKISITNNLFNFDKALGFYSKFHIYKKCEAIFLSNNTKHKEKHFNFIIKKDPRSKSASVPFFQDNVVVDTENLPINDVDLSADLDNLNSVMEDYNKYTDMISNIKKDDYDTNEIKAENIGVTNIEGLESYIENNIDKIIINENNLCKYLFNY
jgi:tetratricopeptide (TPR) repeat protein